MDQQDKLRVAVLAVDRAGERYWETGPLALDGDQVSSGPWPPRRARELPENIEAIIGACRRLAFDLVILETPGIGGRATAAARAANGRVAGVAATRSSGAASQLEKIDMLDFADVVAINKFERRGAADALRDVSRQLTPATGSVFGARPQDMPVFGTSAATFNDNGVTALYQHLAGPPAARRGLALAGRAARGQRGRTSTGAASVIPPARTVHLAEIAGTVRGYYEDTARQAEAVRRVQRLAAVRAELAGDDADGSAASPSSSKLNATSARSAALVAGWPAVVDAYSAARAGRARIRDRETAHQLRRESRSGTSIPRWRCRGTPTTGTAAVPARGGGAAPPVHRRGVTVQAGGRGPGPMFAGRVTRSAPTAVQAAVRGEPVDPADHRVRLGDADRRDPGRAGRGRKVGTSGVSIARWRT